MFKNRYCFIILNLFASISEFQELHSLLPHSVSQNRKFIVKSLKPRGAGYK